MDGGTCTFRRSSRGVPRAAAAVERPGEPGRVCRCDASAARNLEVTVATTVVTPAHLPLPLACAAGISLNRWATLSFALQLASAPLVRHNAPLSPVWPCWTTPQYVGTVSTTSSFTCPANILKPRLPIHLGPPSPPQEVGFVFGRQQSFLSAHLTSSFGTKSCTVTRGLPGALAGHDRTRPASTTLTNSCTCLRDHDRYDRQFLTHLPRRPRVHSAANKALRLVTSSPGFLRLPIFALTTSTCELHQSSNMADNARSFVPLTCHGHSRPVPHISFSSLEKDGQYFMVSACKGAPRDGILDYRDHADGMQMETLCSVMASMETGEWPWQERYRRR